MNMTGEKVNDLEDRSIEIIQSEQYRQTIPKSLTFLVLEFKKRKCSADKIFEAIWLKVFQNWQKNKSIYFKSIVNPEKDKPKEIYACVHYNKIDEN